MEAFQKAVRINEQDEYATRHVAWIGYAIEGYKTMVQLSPEMLNMYFGNYGARQIKFENESLFYIRGA